MTADASRAPLPRLRRKRRIDLPRLIGRFSEGVAEIESQVGPRADRWDDENELARNEDGPLWVVLGDSSSQGIGASEWQLGWVSLVLTELRAQSGEPWRVINLSMSGGRFRDVTERQIPVLESMLDTPALVTCVIGSNDLMWRRGTRRIAADAEAFMAAIPRGTLLSELGGPGARPRALNKIFRAGSPDRDITRFNIWRWPSGHGALAADRIHPSDVGYRHMADLALPAITEMMAG